MVNFICTTTVCLFAILSPLSSQAFSPINPAAKRLELAREKVENEYVKMVAGGAAAEEYYDGKIIFFFVTHQ